MAAAGFCLATSEIGGFAAGRFLAVVGGVAGVIASACIVNNILDRRIDARMRRTAQRVIVKGSIGLAAASVVALLLAVFGFGLLKLFTNQLTVYLGLLAFAWYVIVYGLAKRTTPLSTLIGGVAGALPPVAGYTAVTNYLDSTAVVLFLLLFVWQMPHFYAIAIFRRDEYRSAGLPIWSSRYGVARTKQQIMIFALLFTMLSPLLFLLGRLGWVTTIALILVSLYWLALGMRSYSSDIVWAKAMFSGSFIALLALCLTVAVGGYLI